MIEKMKKWVKNKAGVSPIIAIILMVAITVVLAATIYVWVSGMGKGGTSAPSLSATADNVNNRLIISQADKGINWGDIDISTNATTWRLYKFGGGWYVATNYTNAGEVSGGDYIEITNPTSGYVTISLTYTPTNTNFGTWTIYL